MRSFRSVIIATVTAISIGAAASTKAADKKNPYELPEAGMNVKRQNGGWINVQTSGAQLIVRFFDAERKPITPDVSRATARIRYAAKSDIARTVLKRKGDVLVSPSNVRPPHNSFVTFTLLHGDNEAAATEVFNLKLP